MSNLSADDARCSIAVARFVLKQDLRLPKERHWGARAGAIVPMGSVFFKVDGGYRPWFHRGAEVLVLADEDFVMESTE